MKDGDIMSLNNEEYDIAIKELLDKIERKLNHYENYPNNVEIGTLVKDRVTDMSHSIVSRKSLIEQIKKRKQEYNDLKSWLPEQKINPYEKDLVPDVVSMLLLYANKSEESERQIMRADYCLQSNNQVFRIFDLIYNDNFSAENESIIYENSHVIKINIAMFLINYVFETLLNDSRSIILSELDKLGFDDISQFKNISISEKDNIISELIKVVPNIQLLGDILGEIKCFDAREELTNLLKNRDMNFNRRTPSKIRTIRNSSSHGEFYPNLEKISDINLLIDNNGVQRYNLSYFDILGIANDSVSMLSNQGNIKMFLELLHSNNLPSTIQLQISSEEGKNKLIETMCILSLYNIIQYNNEKHFRDNIEINDNLRHLGRLELDDTKGENYLNNMNLQYYFNPSFNPATSDDILQTIKYSISHITYSFDGQLFTFKNSQDKSRNCTCNIGRLLVLISEDEIYNLSRSTSYYEKITKVKKEIIDKYVNGNHSLQFKNYKEAPEIETYNSIDVSNIDNNINKKSK